MKKQNRTIDLLSKEFLLLIFVIALGMSGLFFIISYSIYLNEPSYSITEKVCWNETNRENLYYPNDFIQTNCPKSFIEQKEVKCYDKNENEIIGVKCFEKPKYILCFESKKEFQSKVFLVINVNENTITSYASAYSPIGKNTFHPTSLMAIPSENDLVIEKCEDKEVDKIVYEDKSSIIYKECVETFTELRDAYSMYTDIPTEEFVRKDCLKYSYTTISAEDINQEFLDENCECINPICPKGYDYEELGDSCFKLKHFGEIKYGMESKYKVCKEYSCFNKYEVIKK